MVRDATVTRNSIDTPVEAMSRRALLTASAGLLGAAALAPDAAMAQAPAAAPTARAVGCCEAGAADKVADGCVLSGDRGVSTTSVNTGASP
jgi:hypothetical protein